MREGKMTDWDWESSFLATQNDRLCDKRNSLGDGLSVAGQDEHSLDDVKRLGFFLEEDSVPREAEILEGLDIQGLDNQGVQKPSEPETDTKTGAQELSAHALEDLMQRAKTIGERNAKRQKFPTAHEGAEAASQASSAKDGLRWSPEAQQDALVRAKRVSRRNTDPIRGYHKLNSGMLWDQGAGSYTLENNPNDDLSNPDDQEMLAAFIAYASSKRYFSEIKDELRKDGTVKSGVSFIKQEPSWALPSSKPDYLGYHNSTTAIPKKEPRAVDEIGSKKRKMSF